MRALHCCALAFTLAGCAARPASQPDFVTVDQQIRGVALSRDDSRQAVKRFQRFWSDVTLRKVQADTKSLYAPEAFFNDTLKTLRGNQAIEEYFIRLASNTAFTRVTVKDIAQSGPNYYVRWEMAVQIKGSKQTIRTIGITLLRFQKDGRIVMHQDFWDSTAGLFEYLPAVGPAIRSIKTLL